MSTFSAIYIQSDNEPVGELFQRLAADLKKQGYFFTLRYHQALRWVQIWVEEFENVVYYTKTLSSLWPEQQIVGLAAQTVVDALGYWQYCGGEPQRILVSGMREERTWEEVSGTEQSWEQKIFQGQTPTPGQTEPGFSHWEMHKIGQTLQLPGFGLPEGEAVWTAEIVTG